MTVKANVTTVQSAITDEIFFAFGCQRRGVLRRSLGWTFGLPTRRFARMMVAVDDAVAVGGAPAGCQVMMDALNVRIKTQGLENIPAAGPLLILSNHPGAYDSMAIGSKLPRKDLNAVVTGTRLYGALPHVRPKLLFVSKKPSEDMATLRGAIDRLNRGESLLQFGSGRIEPDPATDPVDDGVFARWSSSLEVLLRKVPGLAVVPTIASGVLLKRFRDSILTRFRKTDMDRRRLAEFIQVIQQLVFPKSVDARTSISFGQPFTLADLVAESEGRRLMPAAIARVQQTLAEHLIWISQGRQFS